MASWRTYILFTIIILLIEAKDKQGRYRPKTTTAPNPQEPFGQEGMSEEYKIKVGNRIEPVIFEPQRKIKLSRSTYKVTSYVDFKPYKQSFRQFGQYIGKFIHDLHDPQYVSTLYNTERQAGDPVISRSPEAKTYFTQATCWQPTYRCRLQNQFIQLTREANKIHQIYLETYRKFLRAIDHMEFHPTLGRTKTESPVRFRRQPNNNDQKASQYTNHMK